MVHHGISYGESSASALPPTQGGLDMARNAITTGLHLLESADYPAYLQHCVATRHDARNRGPLLRSLRGLLSAVICDLTTSDMRAIYSAPPPTWVAARW